MKYPVRFDRLDSTGEMLTHGAPLPSVAEFERQLPRHADVLDMGAAQGLNSIYLALQGHRVFAVEKDPGYASDAAYIARALGDVASRHFIVAGDIRKPMFNRQFDAVVCTRVLQHVPKSQTESAVDTLISLTKEGGLNLLFAYTGTDEQQKVKPQYNLLRPGELVQIYNDRGWEIVGEPQEKVVPLRLWPDGKTTVDSYALLTARKPAEKVLSFSERVKQATGADADYWRKANPSYFNTLLSQYG